MSHMNHLSHIYHKYIYYYVIHESENKCLEAHIRKQPTRRQGSNTSSMCRRNVANETTQESGAEQKEYSPHIDWLPIHQGPSVTFLYTGTAYGNGASTLQVYNCANPH